MVVLITRISSFEAIMEQILSFGGGVQTTAMAIMLANGEIQADAVVFADTGCEKPETYWYMENYTKPMLDDEGIVFVMLKNEKPNYDGGLYEHCWRIRDVPAVMQRWCSDHYKYRVIKKAYPEAQQMIGFSFDEQFRAINQMRKRRECKIFPLVDMQITGVDCHRIIQNYGWPIPIKSSCYICPFQRPWQWNWLKSKHHDLFDKAVELEARMYDRMSVKYPDLRERYGLFGGKPLWKYAKGEQLSFDLVENSCWTGQCGN